MANVSSMKQLLEAGVHFGHQTRRWNPKMRPFIFQARNGIHILDLQQTVLRLNEAYKFVTNLTANGDYILFVGTKKQAQESIREEAERSGQFFVNHRWLGGMLTNFQTIQLRIRYMKDLEARKEAGEFERLPKKEAQHLTDELERLDSILGGIRNMRRLPGAVFVVDTRKEHTAVLEARRLEIPVVALADTNCDPDEMDYPIPSNDDAIRAVKLLCTKMADAALEGRRQYEALRDEGGRRPTAAPVALEEFGPEPDEAPAVTATEPASAAPATAEPAAAVTASEATPAVTATKTASAAPAATASEPAAAAPTPAASATEAESAATVAEPAPVAAVATATAGKTSTPAEKATTEAAPAHKGHTHAAAADTSVVAPAVALAAHLATTAQ